MATIKNIQIGTTNYSIEDANARESILELQNKFGDNNEGAISLGTGFAEGVGSVVIGSGSAYSENSIAIGNTSSGCKGFYFSNIDNNLLSFYLSTSQNDNTWDNETDTPQIQKWQIGDKISYKNGTRYVLKSTIKEIDYGGAPSGGPVIYVDAFPSNNFTKYQPEEGEEIDYTEYSIINPKRPDAGTIAFAEGSFSAGLNNSAAGTASISLGQNNLSAGEWSVTEGRDNTAIGTASHAEGYNTTAAGYAHSEGYETKASGSFSHAEGCRTEAVGSYSHAEGGYKWNATDGPLTKKGVEIFGSRAQGQYSHAENYRTLAYGNNSHAEGEETVASGKDSHAEGFQTQANGNYSHAEGDQTVAYEYGCHAEGCETAAIGESSHAEGQGCKALGNESHAEGYGTVSYGDESHSEGYGTIAFGQNAHAEGGGYLSIKITGVDTAYTLNLGSNSSGAATSIKAGQIIYYDNTYATITGYTRSKQLITVDKALSNTSISNQTAIILRPTASGVNSHAEGYCTVASGASSHAEGYQSRATGNYSHAEGTNTVASGIQSHAEGHDTQALGDSSHAQNKSTIAFDYASTAIGSFNQYWDDHIVNEFDAGNDLFIVGNGTSSDARSNAFRVDFSGNVFATNSSMSTGADYAEYFEWADKNPNTEDRIGRFVSLTNGNQIALANMGDEILGIVSGHAAIIGDAYEDSWNGMYDRDIYGRLQYEEVEVEYEEVDEEGNIITRTAIETHIKRNPDYDPTQTYVPRSKRPEWAPVGLLGKLIVIDDGSCVPGGKCSCGINGIAMASETGYHVLKRLDATHIQILLK